MPHYQNVVTKERISYLEDLSHDHTREGRLWPDSATIVYRERRWFAVRDAASKGAFHLRIADTRPNGYHKPSTSEPHGAVYAPIHPLMTAEDIEGATYAYDDGTHWMFAHCSPDEQIDLAARAETFTVNQFDLELAATLRTLGNATDLATRTVARQKVDSMHKFALLAGRKAHALVLAQTLGHYHRDPHHDHLRDIADSCIQSEYLRWVATTGLDDEALRVQTAVGDIRMRLSSKHKIEWRPQRVKRLNDAAAARGEDPVAGREYCYTLSQTAAVITGAANLPDPTWPFDRLRTGTVGRGLFVYSDAQPATNRLLSYIVRFWREIPEGTKPGASMGSVPWTQEPAFQP